MLKDLIVNISVGAEDDSAAGYALSIAQTFDAHVTGIAFALKPVVPAMVVEGLSVDLIQNAIDENARAAQVAINRFESSARKHGVSTETLSITAMLDDAAGGFAKIARSFDLSVIAQASPDKSDYNDVFIESALFMSGRPIVIVPYIQKAPIKLERIICCWDGGQPAARAIADAMPFLQRAKTIDLLMIKTGENKGPKIAGTDMAQHLARHKLNVNIRQVVAPDSDVANVVLSEAADSDADFLVMGGYGHSRWRELVLGGATRGILSSMTIPTLMSH